LNRGLLPRLFCEDSGVFHVSHNSSENIHIEANFIPCALRTRRWFHGKRLAPGFAAKIRFDQGLKTTIGYALTHPECQMEAPEFDAWCEKLIKARERAIAELHSRE
jgi:hypothetical protein